MINLPENDFYFEVPFDLFRRGNSTEAKLTNVRTENTGSSVDVDVVEIRNIVNVIANNKGVSLFGSDPGTRGIWILEAGTSINVKLKIHNDRPGHYMIVPTETMPLSMFVSLLEEIAAKCRKVR